MSASTTKAMPAPKKGDAWLQKMGIGMTRLRAQPPATSPEAPPRAATPAPPSAPATAAAPPRPAAPPNPSATAAAPPRPAVPATPSATAAAPTTPAPPRPARPPGAPPARPTSPAPDTPDQKDYKAAYAAIQRANATLAAAKPGTEVSKLAAAFQAIPMPPDPANVANFKQALIDAQSKLDAAQPIEGAASYDFMARYLLPDIRKAGIYTAQSGPMKGQENDNADIVRIAGKSNAALKKQDFETAKTLLKEAAERARAVNRPYDTLVQIEQAKPLFARVDKLLGQRKLPADLKAARDDYRPLVKAHDAAMKTKNYDDWGTSFRARLGMAKQIIRSGQTAQVDDWFNATQAKPAEGAGSGGGIATGLATMPDLSAMSEEDKLAAMAKQTNSTPDGVKRQVTGLYARALADGQKLDLTPAQIAAAAGYSGINYANMNGLLRGSLDTSKIKPESLDLMKVQIELLCQALEKLPDYDPGGFPLFRWETPYGDYLQSRYQVDSPVFEIKEFWSTGAGGGSAVGGVTTEIVIWGKKKSKAKSISALSIFGGTEGARGDGGRLKGQGAGEVLFAPGTKFKTRTFTAFDAANKEVLVRVDSKDKSTVELHYRVEIEEV